MSTHYLPPLKIQVTGVTRVTNLARRPFSLAFTPVTRPRKHPYTARDTVSMCNASNVAEKCRTWVNQIFGRAIGLGLTENDPGSLQGFLTVQIPNPQKSGVPRVPCVPKPLKIFNFGAYNAGTQIANGWNTWATPHKRCSRADDASKRLSPSNSDGPLASPGVNARVYSVPRMGRGVRNE